MLSLRAFSRAVPRTTSRIASYSTRTTLRPAVTSPFRSNAISSLRTQPLRAAFSTTVSRFDDTGLELGAKLEKEIEIESSNNDSNTTSDSNVQKFFDNNNFWSLQDTEGEQEVMLTRTFDDEKITVAFSIVDFNAPGMMEEPDEAYMDEEEDIETAPGGGKSINQRQAGAGGIKVAPEDSLAAADREDIREDEDYDSQQAFPANVHVLVQRPDKGALRVHLVTDSGRFNIQGVMHLPDNGSSPSELLRNSSSHLYTGPPFEQLDEEVQGMLEQYLDARGINAALALFIPDYIDVKEQKEYLGWLGRVKAFVE